MRLFLLAVFAAGCPSTGKDDSTDPTADTDADTDTDTDTDSDADVPAPALHVDPESFDFGALTVGCVGTAPITLSNIGTADLVIEALDFATASPAEMALTVDETVYGALPWTLAPGATAQVSVGYTPLDAGEDAGELTISSNDPLRPDVVARQTASGQLHGEALDVFEQPNQARTDFLFTVDRSCSMEDEIARLQENFDVFVATLATLDAGYQVSAVVEDDGCTLGDHTFLDATMGPEEQQDIFDTLLGASMNAGFYTEMGFTILAAATTADALGAGGCNEGMIRDDAELAMIGVTDESEQSPERYSYYVSLFQTLEADPADLVLHAIAGDYPSGCGGNEPGRGWYEASVATGGLFLSLCAEDWGPHLEALAEGYGSERLTSFELTQWPVEATIEVRVDGVETTTGWSYDSADNAVAFEEDHVPPGGSTVEVEYALYGDCDG